MRALAVFLLCLSFSQLAPAQTTLDVVHKKFWTDGRGVIEISENAIAFKAAKEKNSRVWNYPDIQFFDRISETEFVILSYEDQGWKFGRDRKFRFVIKAGKLDDQTFQAIRRRLRKPSANRVVRGAPAPSYDLPVKHPHSLGGCEGRLVFTPETAYYATAHQKDAREWRLAEDVESVWSMNPYHLEFHVYDRNQSHFRRPRVYRFDLKQPLDPAFYRELKLRLYRLETTEPRASASGDPSSLNR